MRISIVLLWILCIPVAFGITSQTEMVYPTDSINFEGYNVYFETNNDYTLLKIEVDGETDFINTNLEYDEIKALLDLNADYTYSTTPKLRYGPLTIALQRVCGNISETDCARINPVTKWAEPGYEIFFSLEESDVDVTREFSDSTPWLNEEVTLEITVENNGDSPIKNFKIVESFPLGIEVTRSGGWSSEDNVYTYTIDELDVDDEITFDIRVQLLETGEYSLKGEYSFRQDGVLEEGLSTAVSLSSKDIYDLTFATDKTTYDLDVDEKKTKGTATLTLESTIDTDFPIDLDVLIPAGLTITSSRDFTKSSGSLTKSVVLKDEELEFSFDFEGPEGEYEFIVLSNATQEVRLPVEVAKTSITIGNPDPDDLDIQIIPSEEDILEGEPIRVQILLVSSDITSFSNIVLNVSTSNTSSVSQSQFTLPSLDSNNHDFFFVFDSFVINDTRSEQIVISGSYDRMNDDVEESKTISESEAVMIYIPQDALKVTRSVSPNPVEQNETTTVKVEIENLLDTRSFRLYAKDSIPPDLLHKDVRTETELDLRGNEKKLLYSYQLLMPFYIPNSSEISTRIFSENFSYVESTTLSSFVELKEPSLTLSSSWSSLVAGKQTQLGLTISNDGDFNMRQVSVFAPLFQHLDLLSNQEVFIPDLDPGEKVTLNLDYFVKSQTKESSLITDVVAVDEYGNYFSLDDSTIDVESDTGSGCGVIGSLESDSKKNTTYSMILTLHNTCDIISDVTITKPSLFVPLGPDERKTIQFSVVEKSDSYFGLPFSYTSSGQKRLTKTNSVDLTTVETQIESSSDSKDSSNSGSSKSPDKDIDSEQISLDDISPLTDVWKKVLGILAILMFVFIFMAVLLKFAQKKSQDTKEPEPDLMESEALVPPSIKEGLDHVGLFIDESIQRGVPLTRIEEQLHYVGWSKEIIDKYMGGKK